MNDVSRALIDIVWQIGPKGLNGECCQDLSMPEYRALQKIEETPLCKVQEIGHHLGFTKSGATRVVHRLDKKGYIIKKKSLEDARICCLSITIKGKETLASINLQYREQLSQALSQAEDSSEEIQKSIIQLADLLNK